jgi:hypothetical protein
MTLPENIGSSGKDSSQFLVLSFQFFGAELAAKCYRFLVAGYYSGLTINSSQF